jgi:hypothetical protein
MGRMYVASILIAISGIDQTPKVADVELKPITPGAWAAWAKNNEAEPMPMTAGPKIAPSPAATPLQRAGSQA